MSDLARCFEYPLMELRALHAKRDEVDDSVLVPTLLTGVACPYAPLADYKETCLSIMRWAHRNAWNWEEVRRSTGW